MNCLDRKQFIENFSKIKVRVGAKQECSNRKWKKERKLLQSKKMRDMWKRRKAEKGIKRK